MTEDISTMPKITNQIIKYVSVIFFLLIILAVFLAHDSPAKGYEASIYDSTPIAFWIIIFLSIIWGIFVVFQQVYSGNHKVDNTWMIGFAIVFLCYIMVMVLYIMRGYSFIDIHGDDGSHLGYIEQILGTGFIPQHLIYPILHVFTSEFLLITGIDLTHSYEFITPIFYIFYIPGIYLLAREVLPEKGQAIIAVTASCAFLTGVLPYSSDRLFFIPFELANALFPVLLLITYKFLKTSSISWGLLLFIMIVLFPPFHPLPSVAFLIIIFSIPVAYHVYKLYNRKFTMGNKNFITFNAVIFLFALAWFIQWISTYWTPTVQSLASFLFYGGATYASLLNQDTSTANSFGFGPLQIIILVLKLMGGALLFGILSLIAFPIIVKDLRNNKETFHLFSMYGPLLFLGVTMIILYMSNVSFGPLRMLEYTSIFCTLIVAYLIYHVMTKARQPKKYLQKFAVVVLGIIMVAVFFNGIMGIYPSSYTLDTNQVQTTIHDIDGMSWLLHNGDTDVSITSLYLAPYRFANYMLSPEEQKKWALPSAYPVDYPNVLKVPFHFSYDQNSSLSQHFIWNMYMITTLRDKSIYKDIYPGMAQYRYDDEDYQKLNEDTKTDKIYSNDEFDVWYIFRVSP